MKQRKTLELLVIKQIGVPLRGRPILLITRMTTDRIGLLSPFTITNGWENVLFVTGFVIWGPFSVNFFITGVKGVVNLGSPLSMGSL